ncbi:MAG: hypothetical protein Q9184_005531, partial [Pyrenodesmia sp. 2 TL-2023]
YAERSSPASPRPISSPLMQIKRDTSFFSKVPEQAERDDEKGQGSVHINEEQCKPHDTIMPEICRAIKVRMFMQEKETFARLGAEDDRVIRA